MRSYSLVAILLLAASIAILPANAQQVDDPVTYTRGEVIYTGVLDPDLDTVSVAPIRTVLADAVTTAIVPGAVTTTAVGAVVSEAEGLVWQPSPTTPVDYNDLAVKDDDPSRLLFIQQPLHRRHLAPEPTSFPLLKRQNQDSSKRQANERLGGAALGGGGGVLTTQTGLQSISGYTPPQATAAPSPVNQSSGTILSASQIPGYKGAVNTDGVSSGSSKVVVAKVVLGMVSGAVVFALF